LIFHQAVGLIRQFNCIRLLLSIYEAIELQSQLNDNKGLSEAEVGDDVYDEDSMVADKKGKNTIVRLYKINTFRVKKSELKKSLSVLFKFNS